MALGADGEPPGPGHPGQARGLSARGGCVRAFGDVNKPYRPDVGIALFDVDGRVLIGRRFKHDGPEIILPGHEWQMPQGGIDANEDPRPAAERELYEETGVTSISYLGETAQ